MARTTRKTCKTRKCLAVTGTLAVTGDWFAMMASMS